MKDSSRRTRVVLEQECRERVAPLAAVLAAFSIFFPSLLHCANAAYVVRDSRVCSAVSLIVSPGRLLIEVTPEEKSDTCDERRRRRGERSWMLTWKRKKKTGNMRVAFAEERTPRDDVNDKRGLLTLALNYAILG